jgi:hypothetical protein
VNILPRDKQIAILSALTEGLGIRATARVTGTDRGAVAGLALKIGVGCAELHDRMVVGVRTGRVELDELWAFVGKEQKNTKRHETEKGDQYTFIALGLPRPSSPIAPASATARIRIPSCRTFASV